MLSLLVALVCLFAAPANAEKKHPAKTHKAAHPAYASAPHKAAAAGRRRASTSVPLHNTVEKKSNRISTPRRRQRSTEPLRAHSAAKTGTNKETKQADSGKTQKSSPKDVKKPDEPELKPPPAEETHNQPVRRYPLNARARLAELKKRTAEQEPMQAETPQVEARFEDTPLEEMALAATESRLRHSEEAEENPPARTADAFSTAGQDDNVSKSALRGTHESLVRQNEKSEAEGLERIEDEDDLNDRIARKLLVPVPVSAALTINGNLPENRRYCRPWTAEFLSDLARAHQTQFHKAFEVSSAVRTVEYQKKLIHVNGNAAPAEGDIASPHLTGGSIDIAKQGMSRKELNWMRATLLALEQTGMIDVEEEFRQACFHITVYKSYRQAELIPPAKTGKTRNRTRRASVRKPTHRSPDQTEAQSQGE